MGAKIEPRRAVVDLYQGTYEQELADLQDQWERADRIERASPGRLTNRSEALDIAERHDALATEAEKAAVKVTVWTIPYTQQGPLENEHPPRDDEARDKQFGVNMETFPPALLKVALVAPGASSDLDDRKVKGEAALAELGDISKLHYVKLERAAWNVHMADDALPKFSLVSLQQRQRDQEAKEHSEQE